MKSITAVFSAAAGLLLYMFLAAHRAIIRKDHFFIKELPEHFKGKTIFFISDIHKRKISRSLSRQVNKKADMIIIGGDIREKGVPFARTSYNLRQLQYGAPILFVWGNHDKEERILELQRLLTSHSIEILAGNTYSWKLSDQELTIAGFDETTRAADNSWTKAEILVSHYPVTALEASARAEAHFMLTGHSHGGQIRLGPWGLRSPGGWKQAGCLPYLISNGYGTTLLPLRFGARAEAHFITLVPVEH